MLKKVRLSSFQKKSFSTVMNASILKWAEEEDKARMHLLFSFFFFFLFDIIGEGFSIFAIVFTI